MNMPTNINLYHHHQYKTILQTVTAYKQQILSAEKKIILDIDIEQILSESPTQIHSECKQVQVNSKVKWQREVKS